MYESEKWKWSRSVMFDSSQPHGLQPTRLLRPWDFPGKSTGVGCHCLLWNYGISLLKSLVKGVIMTRPQVRYPLLFKTSILLTKGRATREQIANKQWQENSRKTSTSASLTTQKPLTVWITTNWKILREKYQTTLPASWETCMQGMKQQVELDMEQQTGSKLRKQDGVL